MIFLYSSQLIQKSMFSSLYSDFKKALKAASPPAIEKTDPQLSKHRLAYWTLYFRQSWVLKRIRHGFKQSLISPFWWGGGSLESGNPNLWLGSVGPLFHRLLLARGLKSLARQSHFWNSYAAINCHSGFEKDKRRLILQDISMLGLFVLYPFPTWQKKRFSTWFLYEFAIVYLKALGHGENQNALILLSLEVRKKLILSAAPIRSSWVWDNSSIQECPPSPWGGGRRKAVRLTFMANQVFQWFSPFFHFFLAHPRNIMGKKNNLNARIQNWGKKCNIPDKMQRFYFSSLWWHLLLIKALCPLSIGKPQMHVSRPWRWRPPRSKSS